MKQVLATVISNKRILPSGPHRAGRSLAGQLIQLRCPKIASEAKPGQFVMVHCGEDTLLRRPLSIHQRDGNKIALLFEVVGRGTAWLSRCHAGDDVDIFGPLGNGFSVSPDSRNLLLVAGGIGIAPLYYLAQEALKKKRPVTLLYGTADGNRYSVSSQIKLVSATEDGTVGYRGMITDLLPDYIGRADQVFACGPVPMYKTMAQMPELKNKPVQVSLEVRMGCGRGLCYGCTLKTKAGLKKVCEDGPVFDLESILWDELA